eukprot:SAG31_NODE_12964_length_903_cov_2.191542_2_plen_87_part_00
MIDSYELNLGRYSEYRNLIRYEYKFKFTLMQQHVCTAVSQYPVVVHVRTVLEYPDTGSKFRSISRFFSPLFDLRGRTIWPAFRVYY